MPEESETPPNAPWDPDLFGVAKADVERGERLPQRARDVGEAAQARADNRLGIQAHDFVRVRAQQVAELHPQLQDNSEYFL